MGAAATDKPRVPELRFPEFAGDWEESRIQNEIRDYALGGNYKNSERKSDKPLIKMGNLGRGSIQRSKVEYMDPLEVAAEDHRIRRDDLFLSLIHI